MRMPMRSRASTRLCAFVRVAALSVVLGGLRDAADFPSRVLGVTDVCAATASGPTTSAGRTILTRSNFFIAALHSGISPLESEQAKCRRRALLLRPRARGGWSRRAVVGDEPIPARRSLELALRERGNRSLAVGRDREI